MFCKSKYIISSALLALVFSANSHAGAYYAPYLDYFGYSSFSKDRVSYGFYGRCPKVEYMNPKGAKRSNPTRCYKMERNGSMTATLDLEHGSAIESIFLLVALRSDDFEGNDHVLIEFSQDNKKTWSTIKTITDSNNRLDNGYLSYPIWIKNKYFYDGQKVAIRITNKSSKGSETVTFDADREMLRAYYNVDEADAATFLK